MTKKELQQLAQIKQYLRIDDERAKKDLESYKISIADMEKESPLTDDEREYVNYNITLQESISKLDKENPQSVYILNHLRSNMDDKVLTKILNMITSDDMDKFEEAVNNALMDHSEIMINLIDNVIDVDQELSAEVLH